MSKAGQKEQPWLFRTYSGHSSAKASNELYRTNLQRGQTGLSVAFDLPTQTGYDSDHALAKGEQLRKLDPAAAPVTTALGVLGMPGFTAYAGLLTIGQPKKGVTVVVAAASGPVGSAVGQIARIKGARAVGIAGGPEKCAFVRDTFGFDAVIDHRAPDFAAQLGAACPDGIDVYFENVGGKVWDGVFPLLNTFARIPVCGLVAQYNATGDFEARPAARADAAGAVEEPADPRFHPARIHCPAPGFRARDGHLDRQRSREIQGRHRRGA